MAHGEMAREVAPWGHDLAWWSANLGGVLFAAGILIAAFAPLGTPPIDPATGAYVSLPTQDAADPLVHAGYLIAAAGSLVFLVASGLLVAVRSRWARRSYEATARMVNHPRRYGWAMAWAGVALAAPMAALGADPALIYAMPLQGVIGGLLAIGALAAAPLYVLRFVDRRRAVT